MNPHPQPIRSVPPWHAALVSAGYEPVASGYRGNGITVAFEAPWLVLTAAAESATDGAVTQHDLGRPGIWKTRMTHRGPHGTESGSGHPDPLGVVESGSHRVFEIPCSILPEADEEIPEADEEGLLRSCLRWAERSARGERPQHWRPPSRESVVAWIPKAGLTIQNGPLLHQGDLQVSEDRWVIRFALDRDADTDAETGSALWLLRIAMAAQQHWRMIRVGCCREPGRFRVISELDLTGAPHAPALLQTGLEALREAVRWMGPVTDMVMDPQLRFPEFPLSLPTTTKT